jgi:hypothetical protein
MSANTLQFTANFAKGIKFAEKANTSQKPDVFSFTKFLVRKNRESYDGEFL